MALPKTKRLGLRRIAIALAILTTASALAAPAGAQWFGDRFPYGFNARPSRPQPPQRNLFSIPLFGNPGSPYGAPQPPVESTKAPPPRKQETPPTSTVVVIGDSMADWLAYGLEERLADTPEIGVVRKVRATSGLVRYDPKSDSPEWSQAVKDTLANDKPNVIVVMLGLNDRLPLREGTPSRPAAQRSGEPPSQAAAQAPPPAPQAQGAAPAAASDSAQGEGEPPTTAGKEPQRQAPGATYDFHTDKWADLYAKRIDEMIAALKSKGVPVLWVGLPAIRGPRSTGEMSYLDELYRERTEKAGIVYVDIWDGFVDEQGRYAAQGPDFEGQIRRLRTGDGVHFTKAGAVKLASYVEQQLRRVMLNHLAPVALPAPEAMSPTKPGGGPRPAVGPVLPLTASTSGDGTALLGAGTRPPPLASDPVVTQVLSRGDAIAAPSGRADDFSWPRPGTDAKGTPNAEPEPVALTPPVSAPKAPAARIDAKKPDDAKGKSNAAPDAATVRPRPSPRADLNGAPRPPLPIAPSTAR